jgi:hypothetical protein
MSDNIDFTSNLYRDARRLLCLITIIIVKNFIVLTNRFKINANSEPIMIFITDIKRDVENTLVLIFNLPRKKIYDVDVLYY